MMSKNSNIYIAAALIFFLMIVLYAPWVGNPLVFDDPNILRAPVLYDFAIRPFSLYIRQFPYFTLGFESVLSNGNLYVSRYVAMALHGTNCFLLFLIGRRFLVRTESDTLAFFIVLCLALGFLLHPVAVYAVGYLVQRTILFATFFLLLAVLQFDSALVDRSWRRAILAGICYGFSAMSKEHAITGLIAVVGVVQMHKTTSLRNHMPVVSAFVVTCLPITVWIGLSKLGLVGQIYEADAQTLMSASTFPNQGFKAWLFSVALQCKFYFQYLKMWWWPDPSGMSIDIRPDLDAASHTHWIVFWPLAFVAMAIAITYVLTSKKTSPSWRISSYGLFWSVSLFLVELSTVRLQEPFVLYRSYLWAPGFLMALVGPMACIPRRIALPLASLAIAILGILAWGRLNTFSDELTLWEEAASQLPFETAPGAIRIHYNLGIFHLNARHTNAALEHFQWVIQHHPKGFEGYWGRSFAHQARGELNDAVNDMRVVIQLQPDHARAYYQMGVLQSRLGNLVESKQALHQAELLGMLIVGTK